MNQGKTVFAQLLQFVPFSHTEYQADVYQASKGAAFSDWSHFTCLAYAQFTRVRHYRVQMIDLIACHVETLHYRLAYR
jgi:hypothetical protein